MLQLENNQNQCKSEAVPSSPCYASYSFQGHSVSCFISLSSFEVVLPFQALHQSSIMCPLKIFERSKKNLHTSIYFLINIYATDRNLYHQINTKN